MARTNFMEQFSSVGEQITQEIGKKTQTEDFTASTLLKLEENSEEKISKKESDESSINMDKATDNVPSVDITRPIEVPAKPASALKPTSIHISREAGTFVTIISKLNGITQNDFILKIIQDKIKTVPADEAPDFDARKTKRNADDLYIKSVYLPEEDIKWLKYHSAIHMQSVSEYVDAAILEAKKAMS